MNRPLSASGRQLFALLPEVYRDRDDGDLACYLDACGELLDRVRQTFEQRLADCFPDNPPLGGLACQPWLLPYFAELLDVRLVSPEDDGRREEIANAVFWRQRKGTLSCIEEIAQAVGQFEVEIQEGWMRVATTARVDTPLMPFPMYGEKGDCPDMAIPSRAATHPALPAATVDFRMASRAVETDEHNPAAKVLRFDSGAKPWRQANLHGVPCFGGSYEDASRRTADVRTPGSRTGQIHPRRLLLFAKPYDGFFLAEAGSVSWGEVSSSVTPAAIIRSSLEDWLLQTGGSGQWPAGPPVTGIAYGNTSSEPLRIPDDVELNVPPGSDGYLWLFEDLIFEGTVTLQGGSVCFRRCAIKKLVVKASPLVRPAVDAVDSLFDTVEAPGAWCRFEYCSALTSTTFGLIQASDSIFDGALVLDKLEINKGSGLPGSNCIRYSCLPQYLDSDTEALLGLAAIISNTRDRPVYDPVSDAPASEGRFGRFAEFGQSGCGVLHTSASSSIRGGAEDGGEMGAYHHRHYCLRQNAVLEKLKDYLPLGLEPVLIPDARLATSPPVEA